MPVVGRFPLLTCNEGLAEQTVSIIQPIADGRLAYGRHRIHIAGGQTAQAAVAQRRIHLVLQYIGKANLITVEHCLDGIVPAEIKQVIAGQTTQQELHGEIIDMTREFLTVTRSCGFRGEAFVDRRADRLPPF